ncbi:cupin domain-containing protein [Vibrio profundum]|uniref:cupin domain-containing protein n=1 Tax=Vibrio profundum TaxID=2910247 RepID=UPI003D138384
MLHLSHQQVIEQLDLIPHEEGGYFRQTYQSSSEVKTDREHNGGFRQFSSSIYYMLTEESAIGFFHKNLSPILHFYHGGSPLTYRFIYPDGKTEEHVLGPDITKGHKLQLVGPSNVWKSSELEQGGSFGLVSEVVIPGWEIFDRTLATYQELLSLHPEHMSWVRQYTCDA